MSATGMPPKKKTQAAQSPVHNTHGKHNNKKPQHHNTHHNATHHNNKKHNATHHKTHNTHNNSNAENNYNENENEYNNENYNNEEYNNENYNNEEYNNEINYNAHNHNHNHNHINVSRTNQKPPLINLQHRTVQLNDKTIQLAKIARLLKEAARKRTKSDKGNPPITSTNVHSTTINNIGRTLTNLEAHTILTASSRRQGMGGYVTHAIYRQQLKSKHHNLEGNGPVSTLAKKSSVPPAPCMQDIEAGKDPIVTGCFYNHLQQKLQKPLAAVAAGQWQCGGAKDYLGSHQIGVVEFAKMLAAKPQSQMKHGDRRGLLVYHNTGAGKTISAMGIIAAFAAHRNNPALKRDIYFATTNDNLKQNPASEYAKNTLVFFPEYAENLFGPALASLKTPRELWTQAEYKKAGSEMKAWCTSEGAAAIQKLLGRTAGQGVMGVSYWVLAGKSANNVLDKIPSSKNGAVLIMDESQNMFKPKAKKGSNEDVALKRLATSLVKEAYMKNCIVFALTATPGDTASQVVSMLNIVRPFGTEPFTSKAYVANPRLGHGLLSYADIRGDKTHYGELMGGRAQNENIPHDPRYYAAFLVQFNKFKEEYDLDKNPDRSKDFFVKSRIASCVINLAQVKPFFEAEELDKLEAANPPAIVKLGEGSRQVMLSRKMRIAIKNVMSIHGCQYMYVADPAVLKAMNNALQAAGMKRVIPSEVLHEVEVEDNSGQSKRVLKVKPGAFSGNEPRFYPFYSGTMDGQKGNVVEMKAILDYFKSKDNKTGEHIKLFIGTSYEGLDLGWLQAVHITAPLPSKADDDQAVGRALRYCGHDPSAKSVKVIRYLGTAPNQQELEAVAEELKPAKRRDFDAAYAKVKQYGPAGINAYVYADAERRGTPMNKFMSCIKGQAIECGPSGYLLDPLQYGPKIQCGARCNVQLDDRGELVLPPKLLVSGNAMPASQPRRPGPTPQPIKRPASVSVQQPKKSSQTHQASSLPIKKPNIGRPGSTPHPYPTHHPSNYNRYNRHNIHNHNNHYTHNHHNHNNHNNKYRPSTPPARNVMRHSYYNNVRPISTVSQARPSPVSRPLPVEYYPGRRGGFFTWLLSPFVGRKRYY